MFKGVGLQLKLYPEPCKLLASTGCLLLAIYTPDLASTFDFSWVNFKMKGDVGMA